ncbi:hypothetical protein ILYODFUR_037890 [Ilyodon furcidens]|uniref:Uncharacterized protein n=1 Tax=Ilyodon furcidens TaxID=33524 RepID=A0ABV0U2D7_9TELE
MTFMIFSLSNSWSCGDSLSRDGAKLRRKCSLGEKTCGGVGGGGSGGGRFWRASRSARSKLDGSSRGRTLLLLPARLQFYISVLMCRLFDHRDKDGFTQSGGEQVKHRGTGAWN